MNLNFSNSDVHFEKRIKNGVIEINKDADEIYFGENEINVGGKEISIESKRISISDNRMNNGVKVIST